MHPWPLRRRPQFRTAQAIAVVAVDDRRVPVAGGLRELAQRQALPVMLDEDGCGSRHVSLGYGDGESCE